MKIARLEQIKLCSTIGRVLFGVGVVIVAIPVLFAIPGAFILGVGYILTQVGEDMWNIHHNQPKRAPANETFFPWERR